MSSSERSNRNETGNLIPNPEKNEIIPWQWSYLTKSSHLSSFLSENLLRRGTSWAKRIQQNVFHKIPLVLLPSDYHAHCAASACFWVTSSGSHYKIPIYEASQKKRSSNFHSNCSVVSRHNLHATLLSRATVHSGIITTGASQDAFNVDNRWRLGVLLRYQKGC